MVPKNVDFSLDGELTDEQVEQAFRMVQDCRTLNDVTRTEGGPTMNPDELIDEVVGHIFSKLDLTSGYWQLRLKKGHEHKTAFQTPFGVYEWLVVPMGLKNAPARFALFIQSLVGDLKFARFYLDDIVVFSQSTSKHLQHLKIVLDWLQKENIILSSKKCKFGVGEVEFLGHLVDSNGIRMMRDKLEAIAGWPPPGNIT
jgi:hypothetical protein